MKSKLKKPPPCWLIQKTDDNGEITGLALKSEVKGELFYRVIATNLENPLTGDEMLLLNAFFAKLRASWYCKSKPSPRLRLLKRSMKEALLDVNTIVGLANTTK